MNCNEYERIFYMINDNRLAIFQSDNYAEWTILLDQSNR
jgi:hypothetical protein